MPFFETNIGIFVIVLAQCFLVMMCVLASLAFIMYGERKVWGLLQLRRGPNVVGPFGILQSFADLLKHVFKEIIVPTQSDKVVFFLAPLISFVLALIAWVVVPFNEGWVISELKYWHLVSVCCFKLRSLWRYNGRVGIKFKVSIFG